MNSLSVSHGLVVESVDEVKALGKLLSGLGQGGGGLEGHELDRNAASFEDIVEL